MPIQSAGQIGKSSTLSALIEYLKAGEVPYRALDCDPEHKTLSGWHPEAGRCGFRKESDLLRIFEHLGKSPVELVDFPAQATSLILSAFEKYNATALLAEKGVKITILIFANEDQAGLAGAYKIVSALGKNVDYLVVENSAKFGSEGFWESKVGELFKDHPVIRLEPLEGEIVTKVKDLSKVAGRTINFIEASSQLDGFHGAGLECWKDSTFSEIHKNRSLLLPTGVKVKGTFKEKSEKSQSEINITDLF